MIFDFLGASLLRSFADGELIYFSHPTSLRYAAHLTARVSSGITKI